MTRMKRNLYQPKRGGTVTSFLAVFFLISIRFLYFGFRYFPQLDDYIQHHNYSAMGSIAELSESLGLFAARPLAGLLDITLWSKLWPVSIVGVLLISAVYAFSAIAFQRLFSDLFGTSPFFCIIYALLPLGIEGTYWMSASTRIVPGLLFVALSARRFYAFLEEGGKRDFVISAVLQFLTFCFYEQAAILSCALNILIGLLYIRKERYWGLSFLCIVSAGAYFAITALAGPSPLYDGRSNIILPFSKYYFSTFLPEVLSQCKSAFFEGGYYTFFYGFIRGILQILKDGAWQWLFCALILSVLWGCCAARMFADKRRKWWQLFWVGALLVLAPLTPFFILENPWFSLRGTVTSFLGIALIADGIVRLLMRNGRVSISIFSALVAFVFCICGVSEIADYRSNYDSDQRVVRAIAEIPDVYPEGGKVAILNIEPSYVSELNYRYHEHVIGVTESAWALTGAVRCYKDAPNERITYVPISLKKDPIYIQWEYAEKTIGSMDWVYLYDAVQNTVLSLQVTYNGSGEFELWLEDGTKFGTILESENCGRFIEE